MNKVLLVLNIVFGIIASISVFPDGILAMAVVLLVGLGFAFSLNKYGRDDYNYLFQIFLVALLLRLLVGLFIQIFELREFFGGDALTYDYRADIILGQWTGREMVLDYYMERAIQMSGSGWGMSYLTAALYFIFGRNIYLAQSFCAVFGAATAPLAYICALKIFNNRRVATICGWLVAVFPAFIIWSSQLLKDGLIIFLLVVSMIMVLKLQEKLDYTSLLILLLSMSCIITLRFYIFFMLVASVVGAFIIGQGNSHKEIVQRLAVLVILGLGLTYMGVLRSAGEEFETYGSLEMIQVSREDLATSADSGFAKDVDVSTTQGALFTIPIGLIYLMFAPFPWQISSFRAAITLPEILIWWVMFPFLIKGIFYSFNNRLRKSIPIIIFTLMLTLGYSIFQGNVGTAYRQRTQIQVFLFMFIAVGWTIHKEKKENQILIKNTRRAQLRPI